MSGRSVLGDIEASGWDVALVALLALALWVLVRGARWAIDVAPLSTARREKLSRAYPAAAFVVAVLALLVAAGVLFERYPQHFPIAVAVILGGLAAAMWFVIKDLVSGVFVRAGRMVELGDQIRVGEVAGRVTRMGYRMIVVETARGEEAIVPYGHLARAAVVRSGRERGGRHVFELALAEMPMAEAKRRIVESALACHWSSIAREPEIAVLDSGRVNVTVFSIDPDRAREIEDAVRRAFDPIA